VAVRVGAVPMALGVAPMEEAAPVVGAVALEVAAVVAAAVAKEVVGHAEVVEHSADAGRSAARAHRQPQQVASLGRALASAKARVASRTRTEPEIGIARIAESATS